MTRSGNYDRGGGHSFGSEKAPPLLTMIARIADLHYEATDFIVRPVKKWHFG